MTKLTFQKIPTHLYLVMLLLTACSKETVTVHDIARLNYNGNVTKVERLGAYTKADAIQFLGLVNPKYNVETTCGFTLYRISYKTHRFDHAEIIVSGLLGVPDSKNIKGIVSWQHGTNTYRPGSVSTPSPDEGIGIASLFSGNGYILLAPDYIGLGVSYEVHPYYHVKSTAKAVIDFLKVGEVVLNKLTDNQKHNLFLVGFSQGGGASLAAQRELEISNPTNLKLVATAPVAGAYNLREISIPHTIHRYSINAVVYLCYLSNAYSAIYNQPLNTFVKEPYATHIPVWFNGTKNSQFMNDNLPDKPSDLFTENFFNDLNSKSANWFTLALDKNEMYKWKPVNKIRFYYGLNDEDVIPQEATAAYEYMHGIGGNVEINQLGMFNHEQSLLEALPQIQKWFNEQK